MSVRMNRPALLQHRGQPDEQLEAYQFQAVAERQGISALTQFSSKPLECITSEANLRVALESCRRAGQSAGPDGMHFSDYGQGHELLRGLREEILSGRYRPGAEAVIPVPKRNGGFRLIMVQNIRDRVVQRAVLQVLEPWIDPWMVGLSFGSRPGLSVNHALAVAGIIAEEVQATIAIAEDLKDAFNQLTSVHVIKMLSAEKWLPQPLLDFLAVVLASEKAPGLRQGGALSPMLLNYYLDRKLDLPWAKKHHRVPMLRYVDDLLVMVPAEQAAEASAIYEDLRQLVSSAGFALKGTATTAIQDWSTAEANWLGFNLQRIARQGLSIAVNAQSDSWQDKLFTDLLWCHTQPASPLLAAQLLQGQVRHWGPCTTPETVVPMVEASRTLAHELSFTEVPTIRQFIEQWEQAHQDFRQLCRLARSWYASRRYNEMFTLRNSLAQKRVVNEPLTRPSPQRKVWVDGSFDADSQLGGWAVVTHDKEERRIRYHSGTIPDGTNNLAELTAVREALRWLHGAEEPLLLMTDSMYVYRGIRRILSEHAKHGAYRGSLFLRPPKHHLKAWRRLEQAICHLKHPLTVKWIRGHVGDSHHDRCDQLAKRAIRKALSG